jgi:hypothetical protein
MALTAEGFWQPNLMPKQCEVMNCRKKFLLVNGPVRCGKTIACAHRLLRHAWETPHARIGIFAKTVKSAFAGGVWSDLMEIVLPEWLSVNMGMRITKGPKVDGSTRLHYVSVSNMHGNHSEIQLRSLDYDFDIEASLKSGRFSCFWFSELSNFENRIVFDTSTERLRMPHLRDEDHFWMADCNPADSGEQSWIFSLFYKERLAENHPYPDVQKKFGVIEFTLEDNILMSEAERNEIFARYAHDEDRKQRYCYGKWTTSTEKGLFSDVFMADTHVLGNVNPFDEYEWEILLPSEHCSNLITGWDPGAKNHSTHFFEKIPDEEKGSVFHVLDEVVSLNTMLSIEDFTYMVMERLNFWTDYIREHCHKNGVEERHWSDLSAFNQFRGALGNFDHTVVAIASEGRILLQASPRGTGRSTIYRRVDLLRKLLFQNRIFISARCIQTIKMIGSLKAGKTKDVPVEHADLVHVFDSLTYGLAGELVHELADIWSPRVDRVGSGMVSVKM